MNTSLNIAFFGSSLVSAYWNGAATYYRGIIRGLHGAGHQVTFYEPDAFDRQAHRDMADPPWAKVVVYAPREEDVWHALEQASHADIIIKASGVGVFDEWLEKAVLAFQRPGTLIMFWDVDAPATLQRIEENPDDPFRPLISKYDLILTYGGGEPVVKRYAAFGARQCLPVYNAFDPRTHFPVPREARFETDLALLANRLPDREVRIEEFFLGPALELSSRRFHLGGSGWEDKPAPSNVKLLGHVFTTDHNAFNCSPLAVLNVSRESMAANGFSPATRFFEAAGVGACMITDDWEGVEDFLEPETEVLIARTGWDVVEHLKSLTPARAQAIGEQARRRMLSGHTYAHRIAVLEKYLKDTVYA
jgi:spore maturation protein CgeB